MKGFDLKTVIHTMSILLFIEVIFMAMSGGVSALYGDDDWLMILAASGITIAAAILGFICTPNPDRNLGKREAYFIVASIWVVFSAFGMLPFLMSGYITNVTDAYFETMSGFTTTGSSILNDIESMSHGLLFWRSIIQWIGGMGIIVLSLAILPLLGIGGMSMFIAEVPGPTKSKLTARVSSTAKILWSTYLGFTLVETVCLWIVGMTPFDAICHAFTTMATGGFSTKNASIASFDSPAIEYIITIFMFFGGVNFSLYFYLFKREWRKFLFNEELKYYFIITMFIGTLVAVSLGVYHFGDDVEKCIRYAFFNVVSLMTSTGFADADYLQWHPLIWITLTASMLLGGMAGSTAGGIKTVRVVLIIKNSYYEFRRLLHPNAVVPVMLNNQRVESKIMENILAFVTLYAVLILSGTLIFAALGLGFDEALGCMISAISNIGPGLGKLGPASNFSSVPDVGKWLMSFFMLVGRLEIFTVLMVLTPGFWRNK